MLSYGLVAAFLSMMCSSADVTIAKHLTRRLGKFRYTVAILGAGLIVMLLYLMASGLNPVSSEVIVLSLVGSAFFGFAYILYYKSLETQQITHASVFGELQSALLLIFGIVALGEGINLIEVIGVIAIFLGAFLVLRTKGLRINRFMIPLIIANVMWAVYWMFMNYAIQLYGGYSLPLLIARTFGFLLVLAYVMAFRKIESTPKVELGKSYTKLLILIVLVSGTLDGLVNIFFGYVVQANVVAIGSAITASAPIVVAILGRIFYRDRISNVQKAGLIIAVLGAVAISVF